MMICRNLILIVSFLSVCVTTAQGQGSSDSWEGLQRGVNQFFEPIIEAARPAAESAAQQYNEAVRLTALLGKDIRVVMNTKEEAGSKLVVDGLINIWDNEHTGSLDAKFDWQNMAESIHMESSAYLTEYKTRLGNDEKINKEQDFTMYIDSQGYWYVPMEDKAGQFDSLTYVRVKAMDMLSGTAQLLEFSLEVAIDNQVDLILAYLAAGIDMTFFNDSLSQQESYQLPTTEMVGAASREARALLRDLVNVQYEQLTFFPAFVHFAFIFSPALGRSLGLDEETITWRGQENCTKMTVVGGRDAGYQIIFDRYGRLVHLRDTDGDTADFSYDQDFTVNIPPASTINLGFFNPSIYGGSND